MSRSLGHRLAWSRAPLPVMVARLSVTATVVAQAATQVAAAARRRRIPILSLEVGRCS